MIVGAVAAIAAIVAIGAAARALGASSDFSPLAPAELVVPTVLGSFPRGTVVLEWQILPEVGDVARAHIVIGGIRLDEPARGRLTRRNLAGPALV
ncbi:hypothetical protein DX116_18690 [Aeromicrobium endophyticum]|uniref:Uncharacterized protein n=2 Tax=Aeromicrobium endophyticum TaxID=2292704 RepID=A0A371NZW7_9ACTN|nr:hypothetical protein DX116_18690 [Aeromicrobium endophyticum]